MSHGGPIRGLVIRGLVPAACQICGRSVGFAERYEDEITAAASVNLRGKHARLVHSKRANYPYSFNTRSVY